MCVCVCVRALSDDGIKVQFIIHVEPDDQDDDGRQMRLNVERCI